MLRKQIHLIFLKFENFYHAKSYGTVPFPNYRNPFRIVFYYIKIFKIAVISATLVAILCALLDFGKFWAIGAIIDAANTNRDLAYSQILLALPIFIVVYGALSPALWAIHTILTQQTLSPSIRNTAQWGAHINVLGQDVGFFQDRLSGQTASRVQQTANAIRTAINLVTDQLPVGGVQFIGTAVMVAFIHPILSIPVLIWLGANVYAAWMFAPRYATSVQNIMQMSSRATGRIADLYQNIFTVKMFGKDSTKDQYVRAGFDDQKAAFQNLCRYNTGFSIAINLLNSWLLVSLFGMGLFELSKGNITAGEFGATVALALRLVANVDWFIGVGQSSIEVIGTIKDAQQVLSIVEKPNRAALPILKSPKGWIKFDHVSFQVKNGPKILNDISFEIQAGEKVGIVGNSGCGKSTIFKLLARIYEPTDGNIYIDGKNIKNVDLQSVRDSIAIVTQETNLLHQTVFENIHYGRTEAERLEVFSVAEIAEAHDFIGELCGADGTRGYNVRVGENGLKLSGGQRQRIVLARALLKQARILLLDEATSALDSFAEARLGKVITNLGPEVTVLSIAHRKKVLENFDRIIKLENGTVVKIGMPNELLSY